MWGWGQRGCGDHGDRKGMGSLGTGRLSEKGEGLQAPGRWGCSGPGTGARTTWHGDGVPQGTVPAWGQCSRLGWLRVGMGCVPLPQWGDRGAEPAPAPLAAIRIKKPIKTKFRLPVFNWTALKPNQISGTVFSELDDERVLEVRPGPGMSAAWVPPPPPPPALSVSPHHHLVPPGPRPGALRGALQDQSAGSVPRPRLRQEQGVAEGGQQGDAAGSQPGQEPGHHPAQGGPQRRGDLQGHPHVRVPALEGRLGCGVGVALVGCRGAGGGRGGLVGMQGG